MVVYEDYATGNVYRFLTNDFTHSYLTIAELYRERWQVECFFKWIKQRLHINSFYGTSQNAVVLHKKKKVIVIVNVIVIFSYLCPRKCLLSAFYISRFFVITFGSSIYAT